MARILVIDDDEASLEYVKVCLAKTGHTVYGIEDGRNLRKIAQSHHIDLVITDIIMPEVDGLEIIRTIRTQLPNVRVIAISGGSEMVPVQYSLAIAAMLGAPLTLRKPFRAAELGEAVDRALQ